jgi:4-aminobutyrate aminotransferase-like enzyme
MNSKKTLSLLRAYESRNVTFIEPDGSWPIVWERAKDAHVWDADGKKYLDLTAAFGVAATGHANPKVVGAGQMQLARLPHAMGDVHPHARKAELARELSRITLERWTKSPDTRRQTPDPVRGKTIFSNSGFEAVESALKTAMLATGKRGVIAFEGAYHGLGYGALNATHRDFFRGPFQTQLGEFGHFVPFPVAADVSRLTSKKQRRNEPPHAGCYEIERRVRKLFRREPIGAILVEPIQARGGINVPPPEFLPLLRRLCNEHGALLILDEIYTGFGRTGKWFACEHSGTGVPPVRSEAANGQDARPAIPDLICLGKALTGGFPLSACVGRADVMDAAWPASRGEALHTSTFLGNPVGCAMALAQIREIERLNLCKRSADLGEFLLNALASLRTPHSALRTSARGLGLMAGVELRLPDGKPATEAAMRAIKKMLQRGFILLPEGEHANVISFTPPLTITRAQLTKAVTALKAVLTTDEHR